MANRESFLWAEGLTGSALRIAESEESPLKVVAGPGTGKTFSMMRRIARLISEGVDPEKLLVVTFTRTAAKDLQKELLNLCVEGGSSVSAGTLHSLCFKILSAAGVYEIIGRVPRPLYEFEKRFLLEDLKVGEFGTVNQMKKKILAYEGAWARLQYDEPGWPISEEDRLFNESLLNWLRFHQAILIGELVPEALSYLRNNPLASELSQFGHVIVDEYQDLNRAEQVLLDLIAENGDLTVIGDEDQSIYSFRCAHPEGISSFESYHPGTVSAGLDECRRCPHAVVEVANSLIRNNSTRTVRRLLPFPDNPPGEIHVVQWPSIEDEASGIAKIVKHKISSGEIDAGKVLILAPVRIIGYAIRDALQDEGIAAMSFFQEELLDGKPSKLDESQAQQSLTLLRLLVNPDDRVALRCWCGFGSASLNSNGWNRLMNYCVENATSPRSILEELARGSKNIPYTRQIVLRFSQLVESLERLAKLEGNGLVEFLFPSSEEWADAFRYLLQDLNFDELTPQSLYEHLQTVITQPELPTDVNYVRVMSLHKSKGLSADMVVVAGCMEGVIPKRFDPEKTELSEMAFYEEQRRLFYVALTRSRNIMVLSGVTHISLSDAHRIQAQVSPLQYSSVGKTIMTSYIRELGSSCPRPIPGEKMLDP